LPGPREDQLAVAVAPDAQGLGIDRRRSRAHFAGEATRDGAVCDPRGVYGFGLIGESKEAHRVAGGPSDDAVGIVSSEPFRLTATGSWQRFLLTMESRRRIVLSTVERRRRWPGNSSRARSTCSC